jgi:hypothetical protein
MIIRSPRPLLVLAALLPLSGSALAASRGRVAVLRSTAADPQVRQSETLLEAELRAARFEVVQRDRSPTVDLRADLAAAGAALDARAVLAVAAATEVTTLEAPAHPSTAPLPPRPPPTPGEWSIWLLDRGNGRLVVRRIEAGPGPSAAAEIALRAVELLRGTLLEIPVEGQPPEEEVAATGAAAPAPPPPDHAYFADGPAVTAAATALGPGTALGTAYAPALRVSYGWGRAALRLSAVALGGRPEVRAYDAGVLLGSARVRQTLVTVETVRAFRGGAAVQPFVSLGLGLHHVRAEGTSVQPVFRDASAGRSALALAGGGGLAVRLGVRVALVLEAQLTAAVPSAPVRIVDQAPAEVGHPAALLSAGLMVAL